MKNRVILVFLFYIFSFASQAFSLDIKKFEPAILEVDYNKHTVLDTLNSNEDFIERKMTLRIGTSTSSFFSPNIIFRDSLMHYNFELELQMYMKESGEGKSPTNRTEREFTYKNFPSGKITTTDKFGLEHWVYEEIWEKPQWNILDSAATILGYECLLAETDYRGRHWYAFFTPEIPLSDGPWKLCGLPGLIMKAWDSKDHYKFEAIAMRTDNLQDVGIYNYTNRDPLNTNHDHFYKEKYNALHEDIGYQIVKSGAFGLDPASAPSGPRIRPHTNYDFEETNYPHDE